MGKSMSLKYEPASEPLRAGDTGQRAVVSVAQPHTPSFSLSLTHSHPHSHTLHTTHYTLHTTHYTLNTTHYALNTHLGAQATPGSVLSSLSRSRTAIGEGEAALVNTQPRCKA